MLGTQKTIQYIDKNTQSNNSFYCFLQSLFRIIDNDIEINALKITPI